MSELLQQCDHDWVQGTKDDKPVDMAICPKCGTVGPLALARDTEASEPDPLTPEMERDLRKRASTETQALLAEIDRLRAALASLVASSGGETECGTCKGSGKIEITVDGGDTFDWFEFSKCPDCQGGRTLPVANKPGICPDCGTTYCGGCLAEGAK